MTTVRVEYHHEPDGWWADSPDVPGYVAAGDSLHEVRQLVREGLPFYLEQEAVEILESRAGVGAPIIDVTAWSAYSSMISGSVSSAGTAWAKDLVGKDLLWGTISGRSSGKQGADAPQDSLA